MRKLPRKMALTQDLVARAAGRVEDAGPSPGTVYMTDEDYETAIRDVLASASSGDIWLYGYGSLLWKPEFEFTESLNALFRRELVITPSINVPRWMTAETDEGFIRALGFVVNRQSPFYSGKLPLDEAASILAAAAGHWGSCAEYLRETVFRLEELGIHDASLWRL